MHADSHMNGTESETENDRLRQEKRAVIGQRDEHCKLIDYLRYEREL